MYEELVSALRNCGFPNSYHYCQNCVFAGKYGGSCDLKKLLPEAADAIESTNKAYQMISEAYEAEVTKQNWIPVAERLPDRQYSVLVYVPPYTDGEEEYVGYVGMAYFTYSPNGGFWCGTDGNIYGAIGFIHEPLAWMPMPEPPKEET